MSEYIDFPSDFIIRTKSNLENYNGEYETTNLINNCLGLIIIPRQKLNHKLPEYTFDDENNDYGITKTNIEFENANDFSLSNILRHIRNGLAHGRIEQSVENDKIVGLRIHDKSNENANENFSIIFTVDEFKEFAIKVSNTFAE